MKRKLILFAFLFPIGELVALVIANLADTAVSGRSEFNINIYDWIKNAATYEATGLLFLSLSGLSLLCIFLLLFNPQSDMYESALVKVTSKIRTPARAGQNQNGSARWMTDSEKDTHFKTVNLPLSKKTSITKGGVVLGKKDGFNHEKLYFVEDDLHTLCIGSTRSGKTRCVVLQSIGLLGLAGESMIISDPKTELFHYTSEYLKKLDYEVIILDYRSPLKSDRYNFLQPVIDAVSEGDLAKAVDFAWDIAYILVGDSKGEKIWNDGEKSVIASIILTVVCENKGNPEFQNLTNVYKFISEMCTLDERQPPVSKYLDTLPEEHPAKTLMGIANVAPPKTRGSFYTASLMTLSLFTNPLIYDVTSSSSFSLKSIGEKKTALFIALPDEKETYYKLASLFVTQLYQTLVGVADANGGRLKRRVNFILDEYGNFVQMPRFDKTITVGGGRGMRFNLFVQSLSQITEKYGKETSETIKGNCSNWIYLKAEDLSTLDEISKKLGNYTVATNGKSSSVSRHSSGSSSVSVNLTGRSLLTPDEVRMVSRPHSIVTSDGYPAVFDSPDLSAYKFNKLFGLGNKEHNLKMIAERESKRTARKAAAEMKLWGIWHSYKTSAFVKRAPMYGKRIKLEEPQ